MVSVQVSSGGGVCRAPEWTGASRTREGALRTPPPPPRLSLQSAHHCRLLRMGEFFRFPGCLASKEGLAEKREKNPPSAVRTASRAPAPHESSLEGWRAAERRGRWPPTCVSVSVRSEQLKWGSLQAQPYSSS